MDPIGLEARQLYYEHENSVMAKEVAEEQVADTQHRMDDYENKGLGIGLEPEHELRLRKHFQDEDNKKAQSARDAVDANLWRSYQHFIQNEEAYKFQAVGEAHAKGMEVNYPPYTMPND
jgi:t-SNARE complex subunit (syntaxin)